MKPKLFNEQDVLEKVIDLFWQHGFDGTSMQMLQDCMGLSRASIYHTFKNKNELFRQALKQYLGRIGKHYQDCLNSSDDLNEALACLFKSITQADRFPRGCLVVLSTLEMSQHEAATQEIIHFAHTQMHAALVNRLKKAGMNNADATAQMLCVHINGLLVMHKAGIVAVGRHCEETQATKQSSEKIIKLLLDCFRSTLAMTITCANPAIPL